MDTQEHFYKDDPALGPADVRTDLEGVDYFFLGNGHIQAAVQVCTSGKGTALGLLIMHPERFGPKREALTMDEAEGLAPTMVSLRSDSEIRRPRPEALESGWTEVNRIPAARVLWKDGHLSVEERFYCPDRESPRLIREIRVDSSSPVAEKPILCTGPKEALLEVSLSLGKGESRVHRIEYCLEEREGEPCLHARWCQDPPDTTQGSAYWAGLTEARFSSDLLDHLFQVCRHQLPAVSAESGSLDASIWQYNREWLRDQSAVITGRLMLGEFEAARQCLIRLIQRFVGEDGDTVDSGCRRPPSETELDQNGELLMLIKAHADWTGDLSVARDHWDRISRVAEFPLREIFRHEPSGLLHNEREYWERHPAHGIRDGIELAHQLYVSLGLCQAAELAGRLGHEKEAKRWEEEGLRLKKAMLEDPRFSLIEEGCFIKRRDTAGPVQREVTPMRDQDLPEGIPLLAKGPHRLNPDTSALYPITLEFVDPGSDLARNTLDSMELLWNQTWNSGGYSRYNVTSEAGAAAPWPITSMFVAQAALEAGVEDRVWRVLHWMASTPGARAGAWLEFYGWWPAPPYPQVGIIPWTWAEVLRFFIHHLLGVRPGLDHLRLRPRLLKGLARMETRIRVHEHEVQMTVRIAGPGEPPGFRVNEEDHAFEKAGLLLPLPGRDLEVEAVLPA